MARTRLTWYLVAAALPFMAWIPLAANPLPTASYASPSTPVSGTVYVPESTVVITSIKVAGGNMFYGYTDSGTFFGGLSGTFPSVVAVELIHADGSGVFHETETVTGSVLGRTGTWVQSDSGPVNPDGSFSGRTVIGDGTGGLAGIHGETRFQSADGVHISYSGEVHFDP
jgi:hypothetical protein